MTEAAPRKVDGTGQTARFNMCGDEFSTIAVRLDGKLTSEEPGRPSHTSLLIRDRRLD
jgi:hypothetical protein